jgi:hypothetical protein
MNKVQTKRLLNVARALREAHAAKKKFDMGQWVYGERSCIVSDWNDETNRPVYKNEEANFCGTPACALGHYAARTDLQRILKVSVLKDSHGVPFASMDYFGKEAGSGTGYWDDGHLPEHFGLTHSELEELFGGDGCDNARTALQAARYIERFVAKKQFPGRDTDKQPNEFYY